MIELHPRGKWDKGDAVNWIIDHLDAPNAILPVYLGDDLTDEDAFEAIKHNGVGGVLVRHNEDGDRCSAADFAVNSPHETSLLLKRLVGELAPEAAQDADGWALVYDTYEPKKTSVSVRLCAPSETAIW